MSDTNHIVMGNNCVRCLHCGARQDIAMPCSLNVFAAIGKAFTADHVSCVDQKLPAPTYATPYDWRRGDDTGMSSITIYEFMTGSGITRQSMPHDSDDFGRCYRLLKAFPEWRLRMVDMRGLRGWEKLIDAWEAITVLYEGELKAGRGFRRTYQALVECRKVTAFRTAKRLAKTPNKASLEISNINIKFSLTTASIRFTTACAACGKPFTFKSTDPADIDASRWPTRTWTPAAGAPTNTTTMAVTSSVPSAAKCVHFVPATNRTAPAMMM